MELGLRPDTTESWSDDLGNLAGTQASRAHTDMLARSTGQDMHPLQVGPLEALGLDIRVANSVGHLSLFTANFTLRWHGFSEGG
jgi:hypothetical protein